MGESENKEQRRLSPWKVAVVILSVVICVFVFHKLLSPAITLEKEECSSELSSEDYSAPDGKIRTGGVHKEMRNSPIIRTIQR